MSIVLALGPEDEVEDDDEMLAIDVERDSRCGIAVAEEVKME